MAPAWSALIVRYGGESPRKCSLTPLRGRPELPLRWLRAHPQRVTEVGEATLLHPDGELLGAADAGRPLLLVDCSWRHLPHALHALRGALHRRRLPASWATAYPRASKTHPDPAAGLASVEALHAATVELGCRDDRLLDGYPFRAAWLARNAGRLGP